MNLNLIENLINVVNGTDEVTVFIIVHKVAFLQDKDRCSTLSLVSYS